jgi:hypothetical protein
MRRRLAAHHLGQLGVAPDRPSSSGLNVTLGRSTVLRDCAARLINGLQTLGGLWFQITTGEIEDSED